MFLEGNFLAACEAVASYLLFVPDDGTMLNNMRYYRKQPKAQEEYFIPRKVSTICILIVQCKIYYTLGGCKVYWTRYIWKTYNSVYKEGICIQQKHIQQSKSYFIHYL